MTIRVLLVDDQALVRGGFRMLIDAQPDMQVVGEAADGQQAADAVRARPVDVVLMDVRMPGMDGVTATGLIIDHARATVGTGPGTPDTRVIMLTTFDIDECVDTALLQGASGFLLKDAQPAELLGAIRAVAAGDAVLAPSATRRLLDRVGPQLTHDGAPDQGPSTLDALTPREREVLVEIGTGATNAEIAERLFMAEATVKTHIGRLFAKLGQRDRVGLVILAFRHGLVR